MGARGNSGVITSQILNGMARAIAGKKRINGLDLAHALGLGTETAYAAVKKPVEGTILTVIREAAAAAKLAAEHDDDIETVLAATVDAADRAVAKTPSLLPILREAGVVDSGGQGLYRLLQGALLHLAGRSQVVAAPAPWAGRAASTLVAHADEGFGYETMFLLQPAPGRSLDIDVIRDRLESMGDSVVVAGDARAVKVHVHSERPDAVISLGLSLGNLSRITVENLDDQARRREARAPWKLSAPARRRDCRFGRPTQAAPSPATGTGRHAEPRPADPATGGTKPAAPARRRTATGGLPRRTGHGPAAAEDGTEAGAQTGRTTFFAPGAARCPAAAVGAVAVAAGEGLASILRRLRGWPPSSTAARRPTRAPASSSRRSTRSMPTRSSSCRTTRTWSWPPGRSPSWPSGRSTSSRPGTRPRGSPPCLRSTPVDPPRTTSPT